MANSRRTREERRSRGASSSGISGFTVMRSWWGHHAESFTGSLMRLLRSPIQSLLTWMAIAIAITLPISLYLALQNIQQLGKGWQDNAQMSVFLERKAKSRAVEQLIEKIDADADVASVELISAEKALVDFQQSSGLGSIIENLDVNPLPNTLVVQAVPALNTPERLGELAKRLEQYPLVDEVQLDMGWLQRLYELLTLGQRIVVALALVLILGVLLIIGNTLRLAVENRRDEITVVKMVGGTDGFVRRPFLYTGFWYGIGGGLLSVILLGLLSIWLSNPVSNLSELYGSEYSLIGLSAMASLGLIVVTGVMGWIAAWFSVHRHLQEIQPS